MTITAPSISSASPTTVTSTILRQERNSNVNNTRIALASVRDVQLNIGSPLSQKAKRTSSSPFADSMGVTSTTIKNKRLNNLSEIRRSGKSLSFSEFNNSTHSSSDVSGARKISKPNSNSSPTSSNATASLAAAKLKLKLQLALYKLQQSRVLKEKEASVVNILTSGQSHHLPTSSFKDFDLGKQAVGEHNYLLTPPDTDKYKDSININLKAKSLANMASHELSSRSKNRGKSFNYKTQNHIRKKDNLDLKLFSIRKTSQFYRSNSRIPLVPDRSFEMKVKKTVQPKSEILHINTSSGNSKKSHNLQRPATFGGYVNQVQNTLKQKEDSFEVMSLPSIHKILKTPMKDSSTRYLVNAYMANAKQSQKSEENDILQDQNSTTLNTDETIDDDDTSFRNQKKIRKSNEILSSSPLKGPCAFGTPNSFSVAKSLLQLGSGFYQ